MINFLFNISVIIFKILGVLFGWRFDFQNFLRVDPAVGHNKITVESVGGCPVEKVVEPGMVNEVHLRWFPYKHDISLMTHS